MGRNCEGKRLEIDLGQMVETYPSGLAYNIPLVFISEYKSVPYYSRLFAIIY